MTTAMGPCRVCGKYRLESGPPLGQPQARSFLAQVWAMYADTCHDECARRVIDLLQRNPRMTPEEAASIVRQEMAENDQPG